MNEEAEQEETRRRRWPRLALVLGALLLLALLIVWTQRKPLASDFIDRELTRRGVPARYQITGLGFRTQRLERISIGDPANPDLTADWAEVTTVIGLSGARVRAITAHGVRLRGRLVDGVVRMGAVDRLLPPPSGKPFSLPDIAVALTDARMRLDTPAGAVALRLDGSGNLADGFMGALEVAAPSIDASGCRAAAVRGRFALGIAARKPKLTGPMRAARLTCPDAGVAIAAPAIDLDATLAATLDRWRGAFKLAAGASDIAGWRARGLAADASFDGSARETAGSGRVAASGVDGEDLSVGRVEAVGRYSLGVRAPDRLPGDPVGQRALRYAFDGELAFQRLAFPEAALRTIGDSAAATAGTPLEPIARSIGAALIRTARGSDGSARLAISGSAAGGSLRAESMSIEGAGGARLRLTGGEGMRLVWPGAGRWQVDGRLSIAGGGLPDVRADLHQRAPGAPIEGVAEVAPYATGTARVALTPVRFSTGVGETRATTLLRLDGPLANGRVTDLSLPLDARFGSRGLVLNPACAPLSFESLALSGLTLQPARLRLCPRDGALFASRNGRSTGGARIDAPRLVGRLGRTPLALAARGADVSLGSGGFAVAGLQARLGEPGRISRLDIARLEGRSAGTGIGGSFTGAAGQIARVPLLISEAGGGWRLTGAVLTLDGGLRLADEANPPRFNSLASDDFTLRIDGDRVTAGGTLAEPARGILVTRVAITHNLAAGRGQATLDVPGLTFGRAFQPEVLTRLTLGVVANVEGSVSGRGTIRWSPEAVTSDGVFRTADTALAAAFGPVTGLTGEIRFSDLLGLQTAPGQTLAIGTVNPGIEVEDGVLHYRLLPGLRIGIQDGRWPLAGGTLALRPTVLAFGEDSDRRLTFDVTALDAAKFINKLEFENLSATGIFDGTLPMIFDGEGGRIVGGALVARAPGGTLAYVGEVSNANLGIWGGIAFDALKSIAYENLTIDLNGAIDGEMVTQVRFLGVSRGTIEPVATGLLATIGGRLAGELQALPFRFNIRIAAPFRGLIATSRSFGDPSILVRDSLPPGLDASAQPVQPQESETKR